MGIKATNSTMRTVTAERENIVAEAHPHRYALSTTCIPCTSLASRLKCLHMLPFMRHLIYATRDWSYVSATIAISFTKPCVDKQDVQKQPLSCFYSLKLATKDLSKVCTASTCRSNPKSDAAAKVLTSMCDSLFVRSLRRLESLQH